VSDTIAAVTDGFYELMRCAPSTRRFTDEPVDPSALRRALDSARFAPSGGNRQGWRVIVVSEQRLRTRMRELYQQPWDAYMVQTGGRAALDAADGDEPPTGLIRMLRDADEYARTFDQVPVHLVVSVAIDALAVTDAALDRPSVIGGASIYPFVQNLLLALRHEQLGASFTTLIVPAEPALRELLAIPAGIAVAGHIGVGHRADPWPSKLRRNPVAAFTFGERYGEPWD
jgi:nitroreductase